MRWVSLRRYGRQLLQPKVKDVVRRKLARAAALGECLLVDVEGIVGLTAQELRDLVADVDPAKIRLIGLRSAPRPPPPIGPTPPCETPEK